MASERIAGIEQRRAVIVMNRFLILDIGDNEAEFIANAPDDIDYLLSRVRAAEELCDVLEEAQDNIAGRYGADSVNRVDGKLLERIAAALAAYKAVQDGE